jgi:hypothetical protein
MCDCDELEFEDFEVILTALSKKPLHAEEIPAAAAVPQIIAARRRK